MKAIVVDDFGQENVLKIKELEPFSPGPGQVVVCIAAIGVNPVDTYIRSGMYANKPSLPYTPGNDGAGIVIELGKGVSSVKEGDRVFLTGSLSGTYAEEALCAENQIHPLPDHISFEAGACLGTPYSTAYRALIQKAKPQPGEWLLVHGATGGVGLAAVQIANSIGVPVIATGGTKEGRLLLREQGVEFVLDHNSGAYLDSILEITKGAGANIVLEMLANVNLDKDLKILSQKGRIVIIGNRGEITISPRDAMVKDAVIMGMMLKNALPEELNEIYDALNQGLNDGAIKPIVGQTFSLDKAATAHQMIMTPGAKGNIILVS
ncbi:NADPH:quinone reductase [Oceanispirochaeta crateris]|uniref:NADPH:quinone reductase n=1 Tax=Oceanispirochaeta crateris TaxID=2518645 RepID=A0A5C1QNP1_9SPIO|nr:NADPH:quinone reductase [Oceanispirochaeta crateris]QEN08958.1 NADPH:quinone reductase [Oceanispirochaeta crateris]